MSNPWWNFGRPVPPFPEPPVELKSKMKTTEPTPTPAAMRAAEKIAEIPNICLEFGDGYEASTDVIPVNEIATIIDQQTHLPELIEKIHAALGAMPDNSREADELRSVLEKVKGEK